MRSPDHPGSREAEKALSRRGFLQRAAAAGVVVGGLRAAPGWLTAANAAEGAPANLENKNVLVFLTDQDRAIQHFPKGWADANLPGLTRLKNNGLTFRRAFTNSCMCSPARSTMMTGYFPAQHGVKYTLELDMPAEDYPQVEMSLDLKNIATVATAAGYTPVYKGKWHLSKPAGSEFAPADVAQYGFGRWNPPDGGANQDISEAGGGITNHDGRYMTADGLVDAGEEGVLAYLNSQAAQDQPFFLVVSLVNPHDVLLYPNKYLEAGFDDSWLEGDVELPETVDESLKKKPKAQLRFKKLFDFTGKLTTDEMRLAYINFYANLMKASDQYLVNVLDTLVDNELLDDTLIIRTADHGEMGLAHGGLRQKNFNFYEESIRVPLIYSNPVMYPEPMTSNALVSHVDLLPTLASLLGTPEAARADWQGVDYADHVLNPGAVGGVQDHILFTYDDFQAGQANGPYIPPPNRITAIRERRWKLAKYYDINGNFDTEWEMYDLRNDPLEKKNLAHPSHDKTKKQTEQFKRLKRRLAKMEETRLQPLT